MKDKEKIPFYKRKWFPYAVVVILIFALIPSKEESEKSADSVAQKQTQAKEESQAESKPPVELPEKVEKTKSNSEESVKELSLEDAVNAYLGDRRTFGQSVDNGYYTIKTDLGRFIGREFSEEETLELAQLVSEHPGYAETGANGVLVEFISGLTDTYGNTKDGTIMYVGYTNETIAKINFETVDVKNVVQIADEYFRVPAYK